MNMFLSAAISVLLCTLTAAITTTTTAAAAAAAAPTSEQTTPFRTCRNADQPIFGNITWVDQGGCRKTPCVLLSPGSFTMKIAFTADRVFHKARMEALGHLGHMVVPFAPMGDPHACDYMNCGAAAGETIIFSKVVHISAGFPKIFIIVEFRLYGDGDLLACYTNPIEIVSST